MQDRLAGIFDHFCLRARVFQVGLSCQSSRYDKGDSLGYIHLLRSGDLTINTQGKAPMRLMEPSLIFYMNPTSHQLHPGTLGADLVCASFDFGHGLKNPLAQALPDVIILKLADTPSLNASLGLLFSEANRSQSGQKPILDRIIEIIIIQLIRELIEQQHLQLGLLAGLCEPQLSKAILAIHNEPANAWTLNTLADTAGMSRAHFAQKFRETVGTTPGQYLSGWRIAVAQSLLRKGKPLQLIADAVGYANTSAFSRAFTGHVGTSPAVWRKQCISTPSE